MAYASAEAEAEADPSALYYGHYGYPYGHYGYGYGLGYYGGYYGGYPYYGYGKSAPCVNAANVPVPCAGRKRREAEAEADPSALYYGYYGLRYPYYGYGYPYYGINTGVAAHPGTATSFTARSPQGLSAYYWG